MTFKKTMVKTATLLLDVVSWFLGGAFVNDVNKFVTAAAYTTDGLVTMGVSIFTVAVFFFVKMVVDNMLATMDDMDKAKALKKKKKKKTKKVIFKGNTGKKAVKAFKKAAKKNKSKKKGE